MSKKYIFTILGGDRRQAIIAKNLLDRGHSVRIFGLGHLSEDIVGAELFLSPQKALLGCDYLILPLPTSRDNMYLNFTTSDKKNELALSEIVKAVSKNIGTMIFGGLIPESMTEMSGKLGVEIADYYKEEELQRKNALPSAEGALMIAMENTEKTVEGMNVLITGYGRIGILLAKKLKDLGANVSVCARRDEILCEIAMGGYDAVRITDSSEMIGSLKKCDVIFNTVPSKIFTTHIIENSESAPLYIEIASSPGGIDVFSAQKHKWNVVFAPSLPGRYSPVSAGEYIFDTIESILSNRGIDI